MQILYEYAPSTRNSRGYNLLLKLRSIFLQKDSNGYPTLSGHNPNTQMIAIDEVKHDRIVIHFLASLDNICKLT